MPFTIVRNDITKMKVDVIVNTANEEPIYSKGTDTAVYEAAGPEKLLKARKEIGHLKEGEVAITPGFNLDAKYIIHAVSPRYHDGNSGEKEKLRSCYEKSLQLALQYKCQSIAFPLIATGNYGYPKDEAMKIAIRVISSFLMDEEMMVYLVVFDSESTRLSGKLFKDIESFIDENYVEESIKKEYKKKSAQSIFQNTMTTSNEIGVDNIVTNLGDTFQQHLFRLIDDSGYSDVDIYKKANIDKKLFHKIKSNEKYQPSKPTVIAFALALELDLNGTNDLLQTAGFAFSPSSQYDLIIKYFIQRKIYDIYEINSVLFDYNEKCFGC